MKNKKGISLIVLIITIVVIVILATAIIVNIAKTNIIENSNEAVVKQDFKTMQEELDMYMCAFDDVKRAGISYRKITDLLFLLKTRDMNGIHGIGTASAAVNGMNAFFIKG